MSYNHTVYQIWMALTFMHKTHLYTEAAKNFSCDEEFFEKGGERISFSDIGIREAFLKKDLSTADTIYQRCIKENIKIIGMDSPDYPEGFKELDDAPVVLYAIGDVSLLKKPLLTTVGSRKCDGEGRKLAAEFTSAAKNFGIQIVCGFADGIEAAVIKTVKSPIIILPNGIDVIYPAKHRWLRGEVIKNGGLILTEYPFGVKAFKYNFKFRNRLLAGISDAVLILQAGDRSGTSITCGCAAQYGKDCYAVPGSIYSRFYTGCNKYIREYGVTAVTKPSHVLDDYAARYPELDFAPESILSRKQPDLSKFDKETASVINAISDGATSADEIAIKTKLSISEVNVILINLEIEDYIINNNEQYSLIL